MKRETKVLQIIIGPRIPDRDKEEYSNQYARYPLLLFQPFRLSYLRKLKRRNMNHRAEYFEMLQSKRFIGKEPLRFYVGGNVKLENLE